MKIIFYSTKDNKLAKWIACSYLNYIDQNNLNKKIKDIFFKSENISKNNLCYIESRKNNCQIIALGCYGQNNIILNLITGLNDIFSIQEKIILINIDSIYNIFINLGLTAINLRLESIGFLLLKKGIILETPTINKLVKEIRERIVIN